MSTLTKTRQDFAKEIGVTDLFNFNIGKRTNFCNVDIHHTYSHIFSALEMMIKSFKKDETYCLFLSDTKKLNEIRDDNFFTSKKDDNTVSFITYSSNQGVILCEYSNPYLSYYITQKAPGEYVTYTPHQPLVVNETFLDFLSHVETAAGIEWYLVKNPGNVVISNIVEVEKLNISSMVFSDAVRFIHNSCYNNFCNIVDYILVPNKICWDDKIEESTASNIRSGFPRVNTYISFNEYGRAYEVHINNSGLTENDGVIFDMCFEYIFWDIYKKDEVRKYFAKKGINIK